jgi:outer membrane receptor for monomeric catechols
MVLFVYTGKRTCADGLYTEWQWEQLRVMKVGGNESATKYFQSHGGSAALASKDPKTKYTSTAAVKYKDELKRRAAADAQQSVPSPPIPAICYESAGC